jgi:biotin transport system ATP-binding protein
VSRLDLHAVTVDLPGATGPRRVLEETTLSLVEQRVALIGPNGSGKSTLARLFNGLVRPTTGRVVVDGVDVARHPADVRRRLGFAFTDPAAQLVMPTVIEDVSLSLRARHRDKDERRAAALAVLTAYGVGELAEQSVHSLSGGQRQLVALAGVLATEPDVLVADEPTTLLDLANGRRIGDLLFSLRQQLLLVTHDLELAARCDRALVVLDGRIAYDGDAAAAVDFYRSAV